MTRVTGVSWRLLALLILGGLLEMSGIATAKEVTVDCGKGQSIGAALAKLPAQGPHTIRVIGECHELVLIERRDDLTITGMDGASIRDPNEGAFVVRISESSRIQLQSLGIFGGLTGVSCDTFSSCRLLDLEVADATNFGISFSRSQGSIEGTTVLRNNGSGVTLWSQSTVLMYGSPSPLSIRDNAGNGVFLQDNSVLLLSGADVTGNGGNGIFADLGSEFRVDNVTVAGSGSYGVWMRSAIGRFRGVTVSGNTNDGVRVGQLSLAFFAGGTNAVFGNDSGTDINCASTTAATAGAIQASTAVGGVTNCTDEE
jgi:hypothetical protein